MTSIISIETHFHLAEKISHEFSNIPGLNHSEIEMEAREALAAAARKFDPSKGDFAPYAAQAIRNALRSLYDRQCKHHRHHAYNLDCPGDFLTTQSDLIHQIAQADAPTIGTRLALSESSAALNNAMKDLPERQRLVLAGISEGKSYSEIGIQLEVSKQAVHKIAMKAVDSVKANLRKQGFGGLDSMGFLASIQTDEP